MSIHTSIFQKVCSKCQKNYFYKIHPINNHKFTHFPKSMLKISKKNLFIESALL